MCDPQKLPRHAKISVQNGKLTHLSFSLSLPLHSNHFDIWAGIVGVTLVDGKDEHLKVSLDQLEEAVLDPSLLL